MVAVTSKVNVKTHQEAYVESIFGFPPALAALEVTQTCGPHPCELSSDE